MLHPSIPQALKEEALLEKKAKSSRADKELLRQEYELAILIDQSKQANDTDKVRQLTNELIAVQRQQPVVGGTFQ